MDCFVLVPFLKLVTVMIESLCHLCSFHTSLSVKITVPMCNYVCIRVGGVHVYVLYTNLHQPA